MMTKIIISITVLLGIALIIYWRTKRKKNKCSTNCQVICPSDDNDFKKVKNIQLIQCKTCDSYCESKNANDCCANCQQNLNIGFQAKAKHDCSEHHHSHHHNHLTNDQQNNISIGWLLVPLTILLVVGLMTLIRNNKK